MSATSLLTGTPAQINPALIPAGVGVDSLDGVKGDVTLVGGPGIGVGTAVGQFIPIGIDFGNGSLNSVGSYDTTGAPAVAATYTTPYAGYYIFYARVVALTGGAAPTFSWTFGTDSIGVSLVYDPAGTPIVNVGSTITFNSIVGGPSPNAVDVNVYSIVYINAGTVVGTQSRVLGTGNLGDGGAIYTYLTPLVAP